MNLKYLFTGIATLAHALATAAQQVAEQAPACAEAASQPEASQPDVVPGELQPDQERPKRTRRTKAEIAEAAGFGDPAPRPLPVEQTPIDPIGPATETPPAAAEPLPEKTFTLAELQSLIEPLVKVQQRGAEVRALITRFVPSGLLKDIPPSAHAQFEQAVKEML